MTSRKDIKINCALCTEQLCRNSSSLRGPKNCPTKVESKLIKSLMKEYDNPDLKEYARITSVLEGMSYHRVDWSDEPTPLTTRLEEIIRFAVMMDYKKLGVAFCTGLAGEAGMLVTLLKNAGFDVVSVCCKVGGINKANIGIKDTEQIKPGQYESMCNPIVQAGILNKEQCDLDIMLGLCVGHDSLFIKYAEAPVTVFAVKDRLLGHNPLVALYQSSAYYRRLEEPDLAKRLMKKKGGKRKS
jgi:uncharacterized metal-binding protein